MIVSPNSTFELSVDGNLILFDNSTGIPAWTSNTSNRGVVGASLFDNGNLILSDNGHNIVWESFQTPTDTLLPGQRLEMNQSLRASSLNAITSYYDLDMAETGNLALRWCNEVIYWEGGTKGQFSSSKSNNSVGAILQGTGVLGLFNRDGTIIWSRYSEDFTDPNVNLRLLRLDADGNLRMYSWIEKLQVWRVGWQALENQCDVFGTCGLYGVCTFNGTGPFCKCPFEREGSKANVILEIGSERACRKLIKLGSCNEGNSVMVLNHTFLYGIFPPHDVYNYSNTETCMENCLNDMSCVAATALNDGSGICRIKTTSFISGYHYISVPAISFVKVCLTPEAVNNEIITIYPQASNSDSSPFSSLPSTSSTHGLSGICIVKATLPTVLMFLVIQVGLSWYVFKRRRRMQRMLSAKHEWTDQHWRVPIRLTYSEVQELTENFSHKLSPTVFKGSLSSLKPVVIKQLDVEITEKEFRKALSIIGGTRHKNLVCLHGFCYEDQQKLLIYEYVNNGSLHQWLFGSLKQGKDLNWQRRLEIATGIAHAIAYLHMECHECISHSNLKLENVMLDDKFMPKLTDYGLNRLSQGTSNQSGTSSESHPEKDVFSFGTILLEIITGKRYPNDGCLGKDSICKRIYQEYQMGNLDSIVDCRMGCNLNWLQVERALRIAFWCIQEQLFLRPSIREVVKVLEGTFPVEKPPIPQAFAQELHGGACNKLKELVTDEDELKDHVNVPGKKCCLQLATISYMAQTE